MSVAAVVVVVVFGSAAQGQDSCACTCQCGCAMPAGVLITAHALATLDCCAVRTSMQLPKPLLVRTHLQVPGVSGSLGCLHKVGTYTPALLVASKSVASCGTCTRLPFTVTVMSRSCRTGAAVTAVEAAC